MRLAIQWNVHVTSSCKKTYKLELEWFDTQRGVNAEQFSVARKPYNVRPSVEQDNHK